MDTIYTIHVLLVSTEVQCTTSFYHLTVVQSCVLPYSCFMNFFVNVLTHQVPIYYMTHDSTEFRKRKETSHSTFSSVIAIRLILHVTQYEYIYASMVVTKLSNLHFTGELQVC